MNTYDVRIEDQNIILNKLDSKFSYTDGSIYANSVNWQGSAEAPFHSWFRYREGFSPDLIQDFTFGDIVLDPFSGSGSTMIECARRNRQSIGIELNPLSTLVSRVKLSPLNQDEFSIVKNTLNYLKNNYRKFSPLPKPKLRIIDKVFEPEILNLLLKLKAAIYTIEEEKIKNFFLVGWLSRLEDCSNVFKEGNGIKYKNRKRTNDGYVDRREGWQEDFFGSDYPIYVWEQFEGQILRMISDAVNSDWHSWPIQSIYQGNALNLDKYVSPSTIDSVIFSPPYANRFDYFEAFKIELWMGDFVNSYNQLLSLRKESIRSNLGASINHDVQKFIVLENLIQLMDKSSSSWRMRVPDALRGYFTDMEIVLQKLFTALKKGGQCSIVVGNSAYAGVIIPTDSILATIAEKVGFVVEEILVARHLTTSPQQRTKLIDLADYMRESILILRK
ncbi:MAG: hypothetical protein Phog2KO_39200 [Phototrophicaceae bacterium]